MAKEQTDKSSVSTIGRQELSKRIAKQAKLSQKQASEVLEATLDAIREALQDGDEVRLVGFGSYARALLVKGSIHATENQSRCPQKNACASSLAKNSRKLLSRSSS